MKFLDETKGAGMYLFGGLVFLFTLEARFKRLKAMRAIHELRAVAHIIDMHQLAKDPALEKFHIHLDAKGNLTANRQQHIEKYLHACIALLAIVSKIGQLYVEHFPDTTAIHSVNDFETICTGLSNKIGDKLLVLKMH
jgi:hypothetical protein